MLCGYTLQDGEKIIIVDDVMTSGISAEERIENLRKNADVQVEAVIVIINRGTLAAEEVNGAKRLEEKYGAKVYSLITDKDIKMAVKKGILNL